MSSYLINTKKIKTVETHTPKHIGCAFHLPSHHLAENNSVYFSSRDTSQWTVYRFIAVPFMIFKI